MRSDAEPRGLSPGLSPQMSMELQGFSDPHPTRSFSSLRAVYVTCQCEQDCVLMRSSVQLVCTEQMAAAGSVLGRGMCGGEFMNV